MNMFAEAVHVLAGKSGWDLQILVWVHQRTNTGVKSGSLKKMSQIKYSKTPLNMSIASFLLFYFKKKKSLFPVFMLKNVQTTQFVHWNNNSVHHSYVFHILSLTSTKNLKCNHHYHFHFTDGACLKTDSRPQTKRKLRYSACFRSCFQNSVVLVEQWPWVPTPHWKHHRMAQGLEPCVPEGDQRKPLDPGLDTWARILRATWGVIPGMEDICLSSLCTNPTFKYNENKYINR